MKTRKQMRHAAPRKKMWKSKKSWVVGTVAAFSLGAVAVTPALGLSAAKADVLGQSAGRFESHKELKERAIYYRLFAEALSTVTAEQLQHESVSSLVCNYFDQNGFHGTFLSEDEVNAMFDALTGKIMAIRDSAKGKCRQSLQLEFLIEGASESNVKLKVGDNEWEDLSYQDLLNEMLLDIWEDTEGVAYRHLYYVVRDDSNSSIPVVHTEDDKVLNVFNRERDNLRNQMLAGINSELQSLIGSLRKDADEFEGLSAQEERLAKADRKAEEALAAKEAFERKEAEEAAQEERLKERKLFTSFPKEMPANGGAGGGFEPPIKEAKQISDRKLPRTGGGGDDRDVVESKKKELPATGEESNALASALGVLLTTVGGMGVAVSVLKRRKNS